MPASSPFIGFFKRLAVGVFDAAMAHNLRQINKAAGEIRQSIEARPRVLDLGCWDGTNTVVMAPADCELWGLEASSDAVVDAKAKGIEAVQGDLNQPFPFEDATFDLVISNQVIEHLYDTDMFVMEAFRVLKPGGFAIVSTENMSSWHNIGALVLGWQAFSLTNVSDRSGGIGNPMALTRDAEGFDTPGWQHIRIFSYRGLKELFGVHGFRNVSIVGAGYYPLPTSVAELDPRHAAFITAIAQRPDI